MKKFLITTFILISIGLLFSEAVYADSIAPEAEDFTISKNFSTATNADASGGKYIIAGDNNAEITDESQFNGVEAEYSFQVSDTAHHAVYIRVASQSATTGDSVWFSVGDTNNRSLFDVHFGSDDLSFRWKKVCVTKLEAGKQYTVRLYSRESSAKIDKILITSNLVYIPEGKVDTLPSPEYDISDIPTGLPSIYPTKNQHPRLLVTKDNLDNIRENLSHPQNIGAYERVLEKAKSTHNGTQESYSPEFLEIMQSKAFLYLIDNVTYESKGREAVSMMMNYINKIRIPTTIANDSTMRSAGHVIFTTACIYDWCYPLISDTDKLAYIEKSEELAIKCFEGGYPIIESAGALGSPGYHRDENPLFKDLLAFGIAVYDEEPFIYTSVASVLCSNYIPWRNNLYPSGWNHQGVSTYGLFRTYWEVICAYMFDAATGTNPFVDAQQYMPYKYIYFRRPDGAYIMDADETRKYFNNTFHSTDNSLYFLIGNMYKDSTMKWKYYHDKAETEYTDVGITGVNAPLYLLLNDTSVELKNNLKLPYTQYYGTPIGAMIARTGWDEGADSPTAIAVMKPFENYYAGHMHREVGSFQFYYKGMLALDAGAYEAPSYVDDNGNTVAGSGWGTDHYASYLSAPVAHNVLTVYDSDNPSEISRGGQWMKEGGLSSLKTFDEFVNGSHKTGEIIGYDYGPDKFEPEYSYIEGDLTAGYREDRVKDYSRSYMFLNLFDEEIPAALIVFDRMESTDADYTKSWLLHSQELPDINGNNITIRRSEWHNSGRLVNTVLMPENPTINKVGGEGEEYWTGTENSLIYRQPEGDESGTWRVEINPSTSSAKDYFLNVMQVSDDDSNITPLEVTSNEQNGFVGVFIADRAVFIKKDKGTVSSNFTVTANGSGDISYIITNLAEGNWTVTGASGNTVAASEVDAEHGVLRFRAPAGTYNVSYSAQSGISPKTFSIKGDAKTLSYTPVSVFINNNYNGKAILSGNTVMISLEDLAKHTKSSYNINGNTFTANGGNGIISGTVGSAIATVNGEEITLPASPQVTDGVLYVPVEPMHNVFNFKSSYDALTYILYLEYVPSYKINLNEFSLENPAWVDSYGIPTENFSTGNNIIFKSKATRLTDENYGEYTATLYAAFYNGDQVVSIHKTTADYETIGSQAYFKLNLTVPEGTDGTAPRLFVWDDQRLKPLEKDSKEAKITGVFLNGIKLKAFSPEVTEYTISLPSFEGDFPEIVCTGESFGNILKVSVEENTIYLTVSTQQTTTTYTIRYIVTPQITNIKYNGKSGNTVTSIMRNPNTTLTIKGDTTKTLASITGKSTSDISSLATVAVADRKGSYFLTMPDEYVGYNVIIGETEPRFRGEKTSFEVTIDGDTEIYYTANLSNNAIVCQTDPNIVINKEATAERGFSIVNVPNDDWWCNKPLSEYLNGRVYSMSDPVIYKAILTVPAGCETATYTINSVVCNDYFPAFIMYKFVGYPLETIEPSEPPVEPEPVNGEITNIMYQGVLNNTVTSVMRQPDASITDAASDKTKTLAAITGKTSPDISALATPAVFDRKGSYFLDVPNALLGYNVIAGTTDPTSQNAAVTYTITVNSDTEILYPGNGENYEITCTSDNSVSITPERDSRDGINNISIVNVPDAWWAGTTLADYLKSSGGREKTMSGTVLYKATLTVPENAETATYTIKCATPMDYFPAFIMYKFLSN